MIGIYYFLGNMIRGEVFFQLNWPEPRNQTELRKRYVWVCGKGEEWNWHPRTTKEQNESEYGSDWESHKSDTL